jgi:hypothetical protein
LKNEFGEAGYNLAHVWGHSKYGSKEFASQWKGIRQGKYKYKIGTLFYHAKQFLQTEGEKNNVD